MAKKTPDETLNPDDYLKADQHEKDMSGLTKRIEALEEKFGSNEKIAETLYETSQKAKKMEELLATSFTELIKKNSNVQDAMKMFIDKIDRKYFFVVIKRLGWLGWGALTFILGIIITIILTNTLGRH
jgi:predicted transcriptional regulator